MCKGETMYAHVKIPPHCLHTLHPFQAFSRHGEPKEVRYSKLEAWPTVNFALQKTSNRQKRVKKREELWKTYDWNTCCIVGKANFQSITWQLMRISGSKNQIASNTSWDDLCSNILVGLIRRLRFETYRSLNPKIFQMNAEHISQHNQQVPSFY